MKKLKKKISIALIALVAVSVLIIYQNLENEDKSKTMTEIFEADSKNASEKVNTEKPTETISHPKKEEVKEKPEITVTPVKVTPVKTTGQPIATSKKEPVKKEDDSKKVNTVVKPVVTEKKPTETKKSESTETKKNDTPKSKPTETKKSDTKKPSINDYIDNSPSEYAGDGPTPSSELGDGTGMGTGDASDKF